jgi:hypothetical protein
MLKIQAPRKTTIAKPQFDLDGKLVAQAPVLDKRKQLITKLGKIKNPRFGKPLPNDVITLNTGENRVDIDHKDPRVASQLRVIRKLGFEFDAKLEGDDDAAAKAAEIKEKRELNAAARLPENVKKRREAKIKLQEKKDRERREAANRAAKKAEQKKSRDSGDGEIPD